MTEFYKLENVLVVKKPTFKELQGTLIELRKKEVELKQAEKTLGEKERYFRSLISNMHEDILVIDRNYKITDVNNSFLVTSGHKRQNAVGRFCFEVSHSYSEPCDRHGEKCALRNVFATGKPNTCLHEHTHTDGSKIWVDILLSPLKDKEGKITHVIEAARNVTSQIKSKVELERSEGRYRTLIETMKEGVAIEDKNNLITYVNDSFCQIMGYPKSEVMGRPLTDFFDKSNRPLFKGKNDETKGATEPKETTFIRKDGRKLHAVLSRKTILVNEGPSTIGGFVVITDISKIKFAEQEKMKLQAMLQQSQKMEALGAFAGGIAHDFNNILAAILGYAEIAQLDIPTENPAHENLKQILQASYRAKNLVKQILAFSRQNEPKQKPVQLHLIVKEVLKLIRASIPTTIEIRTNIPSNIGVILADPTQIHQVLMNLCANAQHAMQEEGGILEILLTQVDVDYQKSLAYPDLKPGLYLKLSVADTGCGINSAIMEKIFDPFFTTKPAGEGTGMGLAMVYGIVKDHGGAITVYSEPGKGSTFHLYLPVIKEQAAAQTEINKPLPLGKELILFIDDEVPLVDIGHQMLERLGYDVTTRTSSIEALELFKVQPHKYDLVISDLIMPNMTGDRLAAEMLRIRPDIPIILCTGYSKMITAEKTGIVGVQHILMKPLTLSDLAETIRETLNKREVVR